VISVVDGDSFWVDAYFEETQLACIYQGDPVSIKLMSHSLGESADGIAPLAARRAPRLVKILLSRSGHATQAARGQGPDLIDNGSILPFRRPERPPINILTIRVGYAHIGAGLDSLDFIRCLDDLATRKLKRLVVDARCEGAP
jgi:hypothetical protein